MAEDPIRVLIIGAHPDDADIKAGGTAAMWCAAGHVVRLVSLTDGRAGHHAMPGPDLRGADAPRRRRPPRSSARPTRSSTIPTASSTTGWNTGAR